MYLFIKQLPVRQFSYNLCKSGYINNRCFYFGTNNKIANFAAFFVDRGVMIRMMFQKEYESIRVLLYFFMLNYFGVSDNLLTHTHTHTHTHSFLNSQKDNVMMVSCTRVRDTIMYARGYCSFLLLFYLFKNYCFLIQYLFFNQLGK